MRVRVCHSPAEWSSLPQNGAVTPLGAAEFMRLRPDGHVLATDGEALLGRCSYWLPQASTEDWAGVGAIGQFLAKDAASAVAVLEVACDRLEETGCRAAIGPLDRNTWNRYRLVVPSSPDHGEREALPFFLEPTNPQETLAQWELAGFATWQRYLSTLVPLGPAETDSPRNPQVVRVEERMAREGIVARPFDLPRFDTDIEHVYRVSLAAFRRNPLFVPITFAEFRALYDPLKGLLQPEFTRLVFSDAREREAVGFVFAMPDLLQAKRGEPITRLIVKTMAVHPDRQAQGMGRWLINQIHAQGRSSGMNHAIHALMHVDNNSRKLSARNASLLREYLLLRKPLG